MKKSSTEEKEKSMQQVIADEYSSSLADLTVNSKPLINMLTILAEENIQHASIIVQSVEKHLAKVGSDIKLPVLYLVDSIIKNVGGAYKQLFTQCIVNMFCAVFEKVNEHVRAQMYKLRQTWNDVFSPVKLYALDVRVNCIDPAWPITAQPPKTNSIHVNPIFLKQTDEDPAAINANAVALVTKAQDTADMRTQIITKQRELLQLEQRKLELELEATKKKIEEKQMQMQLKQTRVQDAAVDNHDPALKPVPTLKSQDSSKVRQPPQQTAPASVSSLKATQNGPRIAPVSSGLININAVRKSRDPRLARQFHDTESMSNVIPTSNLEHHNYLSEDIKSIQPNVNCVFDNSVKILNKTKPKPITINLECANNNSSNNMKSVNKFNVQKSTSRKDPRLMNKVTNPSLEKSKSLSLRNSAQTKSKNPASRKSSDKSNSSTSKGSSSSADKTSPKSQKSSRDKSGSTETTDSTIVSPNKHKDSPRKSSNSSSSLNSNSLKSSSVRSRSTNKSATKHVDADMRHEKSESKQIRKSKESNKVRTNVRRNRTNSPSADNPGCSKDIDLRLLAPPEKQPRIQATFESPQPLEPLDKKLIENSSKDVDLRSLAPPQSSGSLLKKRASSEKIEQPPVKKSKTEIFDVLFGNEDVDLRKLPSDTKLSISDQHRVYTPPPPIISTNFMERLPEEQIISSSNDSVVKVTTEDTDPSSNVDLNTTGGWAQIKETITVTASPSKCTSPSTLKLSPSSLDVVRAKLAEATKTKDRLGRPLLYNKLPDDPTERRRTISVSGINRDVDLRPRSIDSDFDSQDGMENNIKIIMMQAQEQLKAGSLNCDQYNVLVKQIFQINETKKLYEAKRRESLEPNKVSEEITVESEIPGSGLTPISDDELLVEGEALLNQTLCSEKETPMACEENLTDLSSSPIIAIEKESSEMEVDCIDNKPVEDIEQNQSVNLVTPTVPAVKSEEKPVKERIAKNSNLRPQNNPPLEIMTGGPQHHEARHRMPLPPWNNGMGPWQQQQPQHWDHRNNWNRGPVPPHVRHMYPQWRHPHFMKQHDTDPRFRKFDNRSHNGRFHGPPGYNNRQLNSPPPLGSKDLPPINPAMLDYINKDTMRTINIDKVPREIRFYDETAVTLLNWEEVYEIGFQDGMRRINFDDRETFTMNFNQPYKTVRIDGIEHNIRFGSPTRELYIDGTWYECFFGGPPVRIQLDGRVCVVKLDGPPPSVKIGGRRNDLCAGKINLIIDATKISPVFLDPKPQKVEIDDNVFTLRFVDALRTVLINELPFKAEFGGLPKPVVINGKKHFMRFSVLPNGVRCGQVEIRNMPRFETYGGSPSPPMVDNTGNNNTFNKESVKHVSGRMIQSAGRNSPDTYARQSPGQINAGALDVLSSVMPSSMAPPSSYSGYQVETPTSRPPLGFLGTSETALTNPLVPSVLPPTTTAPPPAGTLPANIDVNELFEKLVATGIVPGIGGRLTASPPPVQSSKPKIEIKSATFTELESLKIRNLRVIDALYTGMQCSSCGARFPPEQTMKYSQHLDWHFRQNRRDRDSAKKAHSRKWYYDVSDWIQYEEIEDLEEREKNWFENQQAQVSDGTKEENKTEEIPTVTAGSLEADARCDVCHEKFDQFYNEDKEEWQLKMAIRVDEVTYHPLCYEDFRKSLTYESEFEAEPEKKVTDLPVDIQKLFENIEKKARNTEEPTDSSDEDILDDTLKNIEISEIKDDSLKLQRAESPDTTENVLNEDQSLDQSVLEKMEVDTEINTTVDKKEDDDVTIQEPFIETVNLKDEDDDDEDNQFEEIGTIIKIKQEPLDDYEGDLGDNFIPEVTSRVPDTTHASLISSIDGNVELQPAEHILPTYNKIKINISTSLGTQKEKLCDDPSKPPTYKVKESLRGVEFKTLEPVKTGTELSGLCSIM